MQPDSRAAGFRKKWRILATCGVVLVGLGVSFVGEGIIAKANAAEDAGFSGSIYWFSMGLLGLAALNAGICCIADAAKHRFWMEYYSRSGRPR